MGTPRTIEDTQVSKPPSSDIVKPPKPKTRENEGKRNPVANLDIPNTHGHCLQRIKLINRIRISIYIARTVAVKWNSVWILNRVNISRWRLRRCLCAEKRMFLIQ